MADDRAAVLAAAAAGLRARWGNRLELGAAAELGGSGRSLVLRVPVAGVDAPAPTVIVKAYHDEASQSSTIGPGQAWENEATAAAVVGDLPGRPLGPVPLAVDGEHRLIVLTDLGVHPALSDVLLGHDPVVAEQGLMDWAAALGRFGALTRNPRPRAARLQRGLGLGSSLNAMDGYLRGGVDTLSAVAQRRFGIAPPPGLERDLAAVKRLLEPSTYDVFTPGDACPDNNLLTPDGVRFLDFEFSGCYSLFLDAAYTVAPFPTCWCVLDTPPTVTARVVDAYREQIMTSFPEVANARVWEDGVARACGLWTATQVRALLRTPPGDLTAGAYDGQSTHFPGYAVRCRFRLDRFLMMAGTSIPSFTALMREIRDRLIAESGDEQLRMPVYPAFRTDSSI
ncbi:MAG TPA: hypothetical protein VGH85_07580 [Mycobacteriales bacterium]